MSIANFNQVVNHEDAADLIQANPEIRFLILSEPGCGKSYLINSLEERTGYAKAYMDVPGMDLGDVSMPMLDHELKVTNYYPNARFKFHLGKPVIVMLDEYSKGSTPVKNMIHPLFEIDNPRLGDVPVPEGSLIFLTGNNLTDGVGDSLMAHTMQRVVPIQLAKPTAEQWLQNYALPNKLNSIGCAWVDRHPQCLASYTDDGQDGNEWIFNPSRPVGPVVSPRTLERVCSIIDSRSKLSEQALRAAVEGAIGVSAGASLMGYIAHQDSLPSPRSIIDSPLTARIPKEPGAFAVLCFGLLELTTRETLTPILQYLGRDDDLIDIEWQSIFCTTLAKHKTKSEIAFSNAAFASWCAKNQDVL